MTSLSTPRPRHLLPAVTLSLAIGIALGHRFSPQLPLLLADACLLAASLVFWCLRQNVISIALLCLSFAIFGCFRAVDSGRPPLDSAHIAAIAGKNQEVVLIATLVEMVTGDREQVRARVAVHGVRDAEHESFSTVHGSLLLTLRGAWPAHVLPGDTMAVRAALSLPPRSTVPGTFDYRAFLAASDIHALGTVVSPLFIQPVSETMAARFPPRRRTAIERARSRIRLGLDNSLPPQAAALYRALLLGDKSAVDAKTLEAFTGAGVLHILAISGMHLALLAFFLYNIVFWLLRRSERLILACNVRKVALACCIPPLSAYALLAGGRPPVMRSFYMTLLVIIALQVDRRRSPLLLLTGAAFVLLLADPLLLADVSFQLSFAAVAAIILVGARYSPRMNPPVAGSSFPTAISRRCIYRLITAILVTSAATLGTAPLLLFHFNRISLVTVFANLTIEPLVCLWSLPLGFLALPLLPWAPETAATILRTGAHGLDLSIRSADFFASLPLASVWLPSPALWMLAGYYLCCALFFLPASPKIIRFGALTAGTVFLLLPVLPSLGLPLAARKYDRLTVLDIGHGSAHVVMLKNGRTVVIDCGAKSAPGFDCGARIVAPYLWSRGIGRIDDIIVTHEDADHYNGVPALVKRFRPLRLWVPRLRGSKRSYNDLCRMAQTHGVDVAVPDSRPILDDGSNRLQILAPPAGHDPNDSLLATEDDRGLVIRLDTGSFSALFPGDIRRTREEELASGTFPLQADVLLAPHHGSATSNSPVFLAAVHPNLLIVSARDSSGRLFPAPETRRSAERLGIPLVTTQRYGTITILADRPGGSLHSFWNGGLHPLAIEKFPGATPP